MSEIKRFHFLSPSLFSLERDFKEETNQSYAICRKGLESLFGKLGDEIDIEASLKPFEGAKEVKFKYHYPEEEISDYMQFLGPEYREHVYFWLQETLHQMFLEAKVDRTKPVSLFVKLAD